MLLLTRSLPAAADDARTSWRADARREPTLPLFIWNVIIVSGNVSVVNTLQKYYCRRQREKYEKRVFQTFFYFGDIRENFLPEKPSRANWNALNSDTYKEKKFLRSRVFMRWTVTMEVTDF